MGEWGDLWPIDWGGAPSRADLVHKALRTARGETGDPRTSGTGPIGGIEDSWVRCEAETIAAGDDAVERAVNQNFGYLATDHLSKLERRYGLEPSGTEQDRRDAVAAFELEEARADCPSLLELLQELSPHFALEYIERDQQVVMYAGKWLESRTTSDGSAQRWANYSDAYMTHVTWDVVAAGGLPTPELLARAGRRLRARLPGWQDFQIHQLDGGFVLDETPLDFGALRP